MASTLLAFIIARHALRPTVEALPSVSSAARLHSTCDYGVINRETIDILLLRIVNAPLFPRIFGKILLDLAVSVIAVVQEGDVPCPVLEDTCDEFAWRCQLEVSFDCFAIGVSSLSQNMF